MMTAEELQELKRMCNDPFLELGMTLRPKHLECFKPKVATHSVKTVILFEKHEHAEKWNTMHEERIRMGGHLATITLTALIQMISGNPALSFTVGSSSAIGKDEIQARIWYPKMFKNWVLTRNFNFSYVQYPRQHFYMSWSDMIQDEAGNEVEKRHYGQSSFTVGKYFGVPEKLIRQIMTSYPLHTIKFR